jgi:hypothetical protein
MEESILYYPDFNSNFVAFIATVGVYGIVAL